MGLGTPNGIGHSRESITQPYGYCHVSTRDITSYSIILLQDGEQTSPSTMGAYSFLDLPAEVRLQIYSYITNQTHERDRQMQEPFEPERTLEIFLRNTENRELMRSLTSTNSTLAFTSDPPFKFAPLKTQLWASDEADYVSVCLQPLPALAGTCRMLFREFGIFIFSDRLFFDLAMDRSEIGARYGLRVWRSLATTSRFLPYTREVHLDVDSMCEVWFDPPNRRPFYTSTRDMMRASSTFIVAIAPGTQNRQITISAPFKLTLKHRAGLFERLGLLMQLNLNNVLEFPGRHLIYVVDVMMKWHTDCWYVDFDMGEHRADFMGSDFERAKERSMNVICKFTLDSHPDGHSCLQLDHVFG